MEKIKFYKNDTMVAIVTFDNIKAFVDNYQGINSIDDIDYLCEAFNVYLYIKNDRFNPKWGNKVINKLKNAGNVIKEDVYKAFTNHICEDNIVEKYKEVHFLYKEDYLLLLNEIINNIKLSDSTIDKFINEVGAYLSHLLMQKNLVKCMDERLTKYMIENCDISAELLLNKYYTDSQTYIDIIIPPSLKMNDKCNIIDNYIEENERKYNYILMINSVQCTKDDIMLSDEIKLKAKKTYEKLVKKIFNNNNTVKLEYGINICFSKGQKEVKTEKLEGTNAVV